MHRLIYILLLLGAVHLASCSRDGGAIAEMERAESLMDSLPDSSLAVMRGIDPRTLRGSEARALYALTMSRALDRCDSFIASDSIIAPAAAYYRADRDPLRHTMTQYYLGRTRFHAGDYAHSIIAYLDGLETAKNDSIFFWVGMNARELATCFNYMKYFGEEIKYEKESYQAFRKINRSPHLEYSILDIALAYHNLQEYDSARYYAAKAVESANAINNVALSAEANKVFAWSSYAFSEYNDAIDAFGRFANTCEDSAIMALSYAELGDIETSKKILNDIVNKEQRLSNLVLLEIQKKNKDYSSALTTLEIVHQNTEISFEEATGNQITGIIVENANNIRKAKDREISNKRFIIALVVTSSLLFALVLILCFLHYHHIAKNKINDKIRLINEFKSTLESKSMDLAASKSTVRQLVKSQYSVFNHIFAVMNECRNQELSKVKFSEIANSVIRKISPGGDDYNSLEQIINDNNDNIVADFRKDLPGLKDADYALFSYTILGLSITSISILLNEKHVNSVYNRKRHLKDKIKTLDSDKSELYLKLLG